MFTDLCYGLLIKFNLLLKFRSEKKAISILLIKIYVVVLAYRCICDF